MYACVSPTVYVDIHVWICKISAFFEGPWLALYVSMYLCVCVHIHQLQLTSEGLLGQTGHLLEIHIQGREQWKELKWQLQL